jgi:hypothetical protein
MDDWKVILDITGIIGAIASVIGAVISFRQSKEAKKAKDASVAAQEATEEARDRFFHNIQFEGMESFVKDCEKFCRFLQEASTGRNAQGKKDNYVENELESFLTKFNLAISNTSDEVREQLEQQYLFMNEKRNSVKTGDKNTILPLLDEARILTRSIADIQMKNKLRV